MAAQAGKATGTAAARAGMIFGAVPEGEHTKISPGEAADDLSGDSGLPFPEVEVADRFDAMSTEELMALDDDTLAAASDTLSGADPSPRSTTGGTVPPGTDISEEESTVSTTTRSRTRTTKKKAPASVPKPSKTAKAGDVYTLPNGREYISRPVPGFPNDVEMLRAMHAMNEPVLLVGPPGTGKTMLAMAAFPNLETEVARPDMGGGALLRTPRVQGDTVVYDDAALVRAATKGRPFFLDECMLLPPKSTTPLYSAMDGRGFIPRGRLDGTDLPIKDGFYVIGSSNHRVAGATLPDALASRFGIVVEVKTSTALLEQLGVGPKLRTVFAHLDGRDDVSWAPQIRELVRAQKFLDAGHKVLAAAALTGERVPEKDREIVAKAVVVSLGVKVSADGLAIQ